MTRNSITFCKEDLKNLITKAVQEGLTTKPEPKKLLTRKEALEYLNVCKVTLYKYEKMGKITSKAFGHRKLYDINELENFITNKA